MQGTGATLRTYDVDDNRKEPPHSGQRSRRAFAELVEAGIVENTLCLTSPIPALPLVLRF